MIENVYLNNNLIICFIIKLNLFIDYKPRYVMLRTTQRNKMKTTFLINGAAFTIKILRIT